MRSARQVPSAETLGKLPNLSGLQVLTCEMIIVTLPHLMVRVTQMFMGCDTVNGVQGR